MELALNVFIISILIFFSRICDVSLGTLRIIFISKGKKFLAPLLGFFEVLIWIVAIKQLMANITTIWLYLVYALGFAAGTYIGMLIEEKISIGKVIIRIITRKDANDLIKKLREEGYKLTVSNAKGRDGEVSIIFSIIERKKLRKIIKIIHEKNPKAFYTIEDLKYVNETDFKINPKHGIIRRRSRKGK
jgi:uncharacterized protein YebE (UPF0316 family)